MSVKETEFLFGSFVPFENRLLIFSYANFLLDFNIEDCKVRFSQNINTEICKKATKVDWFIRAGDYLIATSMWGNKVYLYESKSDNWMELDINCHHKPWGNFMDVFPYNEYVYIFPRYKDFHIKIDLTNKKISQIVCPVLSQMDKDRIVIGRKEYIVYFFEQYSCQIVIFNLKTGHYMQKELPEMINDIVSIKIYQDLFFILSGSGCVDVWNEKFNTLRRLVEPIEKTNSRAFADLAVTGQNIWLLPQMGDDIYIYEYKDKELKKYEDYPEKYTYADFANYSKFAWGHEYRNQIYFGMHSANHILRIDKDSGTAEWFAPILPTERETYLYRQRHGLSLVENEKDVTLSQYVNEIPQTDNTDVSYVYESQIVGLDIWKALSHED